MDVKCRKIDKMCKNVLRYFGNIIKKLPTAHGLDQPMEFHSTLDTNSPAFLSDGCDPRVYRVLDDPRRSVLFSHHSVTDDASLLCDDLLPFGWYRFLAYGM